jgi:hypothetical protein
MAVASFVVSVLGFVGLICVGVGCIPCLVGAILGHVARAGARHENLGPQRLALWGVLLGWTGVVVGAAVIATIIARLAASPEIAVPASVACWFLPCDPAPGS